MYLIWAPSLFHPSILFNCFILVIYIYWMLHCTYMYKVTFSVFSSVTHMITGSFHNGLKSRARYRYSPLCLPDIFTSGPIKAPPKAPPIVPPNVGVWWMAGVVLAPYCGVSVWRNCVEGTCLWSTGRNVGELHSEGAPSCCVAGPTVVGKMKWGSPPYLKKASAAHDEYYIIHIHK